MRWRTTISFLGLAALALLALTVAAPAAERRIALVIGNAAYRHAPVLENPVRDAEAVARMLRASGFDSVEYEHDLDNLGMKRAIRTFMLSARESDLALVYFAGHGIEVGGVNYLVPVDARLRTDFDAEDEGVALDRVIRAVEPTKRLRLVILDACRDNPFAVQMQRTGGTRSIGTGLGKIEPEIGDTLVAYAARAGSTATDGRNGNSPFTGALLRHLPTPGLDIRVAFGRVRDDVLAATHGAQEPFVYGSLGGSTLSVVPGAAGAEPAADAMVRRDYELAERVGRKEAWVVFLKAHPTGFFADLARTQLSKFPVATLGDVPVSANSRIASIEPPETTGPEPLRTIIEPGTRMPRPQTRPEPGPAPVSDAEACARDRETLARLRDRQIAAEIKKFSKEATCAALRPQIARLLESLGSADDVPPLPPATVGIPPVRPPETGPILPAGKGGASSADPACTAQEETLSRLRAAPDLDSVDRFARELTCDALRPQLMRLRESLL